MLSEGSIFVPRLRRAPYAIGDPAQKDDAPPVGKGLAPFRLAHRPVCTHINILHIHQHTLHTSYHRMATRGRGQAPSLQFGLTIHATIDAYPRTVASLTTKYLARILSVSVYGAKRFTYRK
jgi:hypothetical protein